jgi:deoxyribodipyrimidine photo-lyase
MEKSQ